MFAYLASNGLFHAVFLSENSKRLLEQTKCIRYVYLRLIIDKKYVLVQSFALYKKSQKKKKK